MTNVPPPAPDNYPAPSPYPQQAPAPSYPQGPPPGYPQAPQAYQPAAAPVAATKQRNVLGIVALAVAAVGFVFACIPGALIVGWVLLPIGFILGIVALFLKDKAKWQAITAIIVAVVGTVVGVIVFTVVIATAFTDSFGGTDVEVGDSTVVEEAEAPAEEEPAAEEPAAEVGTRENPVPLGTPFSSDEWTVVINSVTLGATDQIVAENMFNEAPDPGHEYIIVNYTVTSLSTDPEGQMPTFVSVEYVTAAGVTVDPFDKMIVGPDEMDTMSTLYEGASATGNRSMQVPTPVDGVLAISPGMFADTVFVAVQ